jgi:hypothetical protein
VVKHVDAAELRIVLAVVLAAAIADAVLVINHEYRAIYIGP